MLARVIGIALALLTASGAASAQPIGVRSVRLSEVAVPETPNVVNLASQGGFLVWAVQVAANSDGKELKSRLDAAGTRIGQIVGEEFRLHYSAIKAFPAIAQDSAGATLELAITDYGLVPVPSMSMSNKRFRSAVSLSARLAEPAGKVLWSGKERVVLDEPGFELSHYMTSSELTRERFRRAAELVVLKVLEDFDTTMGYGAGDAIAAQRKAIGERVARYDQAEKALLDAQLEPVDLEAGDRYVAPEDLGAEPQETTRP
jgi:hypothetical protein